MPALGFWRTESLEKIKKIYQSSHDRAFLLACVYGFDEFVRITLNHDLDRSVKEQGAMVAFSKGSASIADLLIGPQGDPKLREHVLHHMGSHFLSLSDPGLVRWLMDLVEPAQITEKVILDMMNLHTLETTRMLFGQCLDTIQSLLSGVSKAVVAFLAQDLNISITSEILIAVIRCRLMNTEFLVNLIRRCYPAVITCDVISYAAEEVGSDLEQQEQAMSVLLVLLERAGHIQVTESAASRALGRDCTGKVTNHLLDRGWPVTPEVVLRLIKGARAAPFPRILEAAGGSCQITRKVLLAASENRSQDGKEILKHLASQLDQPVNYEVWTKMIARCRRPDTLQIILDMKPHLPVPESALVFLAENSFRIEKISAMLLNNERELQITDAVVEKALESLGPGDFVSQLLDRHGTKSVTESMLISAVSNWLYGGKMTRALINRKLPVEVPSAKVIDAAIKNASSGLQALQVLEEYLGPLEYTDEHVESVAESSVQMMKLVFDRRSLTQAPLSVLCKAAGWGNLDGMKFLLQLDDTIVTREILIAAAGNRRCGAEMLRLLWDRNPGIEPCIEMFMQTARYRMDIRSMSEIIGLLIDRLKDVKLAQQVLQTATSENNMRLFGCDIFVRRLLESTLPIQVTSEIVVRVRKIRPKLPLWDVLAPYAMAMETWETAES